MPLLESCGITFPTWDFDPPMMSEPDFENECSAWKWCPCEGDYGWNYCERTEEEESCPMEDIVDDTCTGPGGWTHLCGNKELGPPCVKGRFYGEVVLICVCPTEESESFDFSWSLSEEDSSYSCPADTPLPPFPYLIPYSNITHAGYYVPQIMFDEPLAPGAKSFWTWCPCGDEPYPSLQSPSCPYEPSCFDAEGPGHWVHRGGPQSLGPPPVEGRFYGETLAIGWCCGSESSESFSDFSYDQSIPSECSMTPWNPFYNWFVGLGGGGGYHHSRMEDNVGCVIECSGWVWCACEDEYDKCYQEYLGDPNADCPETYMEARFDPGAWMLIDGAAHHGAPPIDGRFYGEIVWFCECDLSESLISSSSMGGDVCGVGGLEVTGSLSPDVTGYYNIGGWFNGAPYYMSDDGWYIVYEDDPYSPEWRIQMDPPGTTAMGDYWALYVADWDPPDGEYQPYGTASGTATVTCCEDCGPSCGQCPGTIDVTISGLSGNVCGGMNGTWSIDPFQVNPTDCYWEGSFSPSTCISFGIHLVCQCNTWIVWIAGSSCGPGFDREPGWTSEPKEPIPGTGCPPFGTYIMHPTRDDCPDQIPSVSLSAP